MRFVPTRWADQHGARAARLLAQGLRSARLPAAALDRSASSPPLSLAPRDGARRAAEGRRRVADDQGVGRHRSSSGACVGGSNAQGVPRHARRCRRRWPRSSPSSATCRARPSGWTRATARARSRTSATARRSCTTARTRRGRWPIATRSCTTSASFDEAERTRRARLLDRRGRQGAAGQGRGAHAVPARPLDPVAVEPTARRRASSTRCTPTPAAACPTGS